MRHISFVCRLDRTSKDLNKFRFLHSFCNFSRVSSMIIMLQGLEVRRASRWRRIRKRSPGKKVLPAFLGVDLPAHTLIPNGGQLRRINPKCWLNTTEIRLNQRPIVCVYIRTFRIVSGPSVHFWLCNWNWKSLNKSFSEKFGQNGTRTGVQFHEFVEIKVFKTLFLGHSSKKLLKFISIFKRIELRRETFPFPFPSRCFLQ